MKMIVVDDEEWARETFLEESQGISSFEVIGMFADGISALEFARHNRIEFALLDIEMPGMSGLQLGERLRELYPDCILIYATSYSQYTSQAILDVKADYYIMKPYFRDELLKVAERAQLLSRRLKPALRCVCFGRFDLFCDGELVHFNNIKAKELLALCIDHRGGAVTVEEALDKIWERTIITDTERSYYRRAISYLRQLFESMGQKEAFVTERGSCHIITNCFSCDYYEYLNHAGEQQYWDEYMSSYSWAEETNAFLANLKR